MPKGEKTKLLWTNLKYRKMMSKALSGRKQSKEEIQKRVAHFMNENHHYWKGDNVSYSGLHKWVARKLGKPKRCDKCGDVNANRYNWSNISGKYLRDLSDWWRLCCKCHWSYDEISKKIWIKRRLKANV